ncbi:MAG: ABC transporter permease [Candidatus Dormibacteraceae bacterium]
MQSIAWPAVTLVLIIVAWEAVVLLFKTPVYILPSPTEVATVGWSMFPLLWQHTLWTAWEVAVAFVVSVAIGVPLGVLAVESRPFERTVYPLLVASQTFPKLAIAPLLTVWFGLGFTPKILVAFLIAFFPVVINTAVGLRSVESDMIELSRSIGLSRVQTFVKIKLPAALPSMFGGFKIAVTLALVGAVVGEFLGSEEGLGHIMIVAQGTIQMGLLFAALIALTVLGLIAYGLVALAEMLAIPWRSDAAEVAQGSM